MSRIFICYRRRENRKDAMVLFEVLAQHFGTNAVFVDVAGIAQGVNCQERVDRTLDTCRVVLLLMGQNWAAIKDESGKPRLDDPHDRVRVLVASALRRNIPLIPVFIEGARMPRPHRLPPQLADLARQQGIALDRENRRAQIAHLVAALERWVKPRADAALPRTQPRAGEVFRDAPDAPEMVVIPAGEFVMGSPAKEQGRSDNEGPQRRVWIAQAFAVGRFAVTFDEWDACVAAGGCTHQPADEGWGRGKRPVINVSWDDAQQYMRWLSNKTGKQYRLLSEAEWEYAARAGSTMAYPWGNAPGSNWANFRDSGSRWSGKQSAPVGSFEANAFGLHDMIGNVWEWTQDCWNAGYRSAPADGRPWQSGDCARRVLRGGSWSSVPGIARCAHRLRIGLGNRGCGVGFRLARTL